MRNLPPIRQMNKPAIACLGAMALCPGCHGAAPAPSAQPAPVVLDHVVAVVNNQTILASDLDDEIRLSVLDPGQAGRGVLTRPARPGSSDQPRAHPAADSPGGRAGNGALARPKLKPAWRKSAAELPACIRQNCASDAGWKAFLAAHGLKPERVESYLRYRVQILRFIEQRFSQGIRISPEEIETYYHETLLPQYAPGDEIPPLDKVSARIEEILLAQQVNVLFDDWLANLRRQGDVEVLDPAFEVPEAQHGTGKGGA